MPFALGAADRPAPDFPPRPGLLLAGLLLVSALVHANLFGLLTTAPEQLPSIGIPAISVEIFVGDDIPPGVAPAPGSEGPTEAAPHAEAKSASDPIPEQMAPQRTIEEALRPQPTESHDPRAEPPTPTIAAEADAVMAEAQPEI